LALANRVGTGNHWWQGSTAATGRGASVADESGKEPRMSRHGFSVSYDGETAGHSIEVETLAPALLAFGKLIREANAEFNGKRATAKVVVVSDFEHKCFNINFDVILSLFEQMKTLVGSSDAIAAKDILDWLGLTGGAGSTGAATFIGFLRWKRGRKVTQAIPLKDTDSSGIVEVHVEGDGNSVQIHQHIYQLSENPKALRATRDAFLPLGQNGFETVRFQDSADGQLELAGEDVEKIVASCNVGIEEAKETEPEIEITSAWLSVYSPVYDANADKWRFKLGKEVIYADISETSIAKDALARGGALVDEAYQVKVEITTQVDAQGKKKEPTYKILEVIRFVPSSPVHQDSLFKDGDT
jgi:hypothetical protein